MNDDDLKQLWQAQPAASEPLPEAVLRKHAGKFQRRVALRNLFEVLAAVLVVAGFSRYLWLYPQSLIRLGSVLTILAAVLVVYQLLHRASSRPLPGADGGLPCRDFHRAELVRQRDALRTVWLWYIAPFLPGMAVFRWGVETQLDASAPFARGWQANLILAGVLLGIALLNLYAARKLQRQIDRLDTEFN